jgi:hypothetical protein
MIVIPFFLDRLLQYSNPLTQTAPWTMLGQCPPSAYRLRRGPLGRSAG